MLALCLLASCATGGTNSTTIHVFAASSLTEAFTEIGAAFEAAHPGETVQLTFGGSADLVGQITEGAPADVFASADAANMQKLVEAQLALGAPVVIARNTFAIITAPGNPLRIGGVPDLSRRDLVVVLCASTVPCGEGAEQILAATGVTVAAKSYEDKVKGVVTKVTSGEADAGIVYVTDVLAAGTSASGVAIPADVNAVNDYPITVITTARHPADADDFIAFVAGPVGQDILARHGFLRP